MNILILRVLFQLSSQKNIPREMIIKIYQYLLSDNLKYHTNLIQSRCLDSEYNDKKSQIIINNCIPINYGTEWVIKQYNKSDLEILRKLEKHGCLSFSNNRRHSYERGILLSQIRVLGEEEYLFSEILNEEGVISNFKEAPLNMKVKYLKLTEYEESLSDYVDFRGKGEFGDMGGWPKLIIEPCGDSRYL